MVYEPAGSVMAGQSARAKAQELRDEQSRFTRIVTALFDTRTEQRAWRLGAVREEKVGRALAKLPDGWAVVHDLTIGKRGANIDHLVIGPPGGLHAEHEVRQRQADRV